MANEYDPCICTSAIMTTDNDGSSNLDKSDSLLNSVNEFKVEIEDSGMFGEYRNIVKGMF